MATIPGPIEELLPLVGSVPAVPPGPPAPTVIVYDVVRVTAKPDEVR
jgi:hypothetical protein